MSVQLGIASPCSESWESMPAAGGGRHCARCRKVVLDLTDCTSGEAVERVIAASRAGGHACARLRTDASGAAEFRAGTAEFRAGASDLRAGAAVAGAVLLAACGGGDGGSGGGTGTGAGAGAGSTPSSTPLAVTAAAPDTAVTLGAVAMRIDVLTATEIAAEHIRREKRWDLVSADLESVVESKPPQWRVVVRRVESFRPDGSARYSDDPAYRVEIGADAEIRGCTALR